MKKIKILLIISVIVASVFSFTACGGGTESVTVKFDGTSVSAEVGELLTEPEEPTKDATYSTVYDFDGWYIVGTDTKWNFSSDKVTGELNLEARFIEKTRQYTVKVGDGEEFLVDFGSKILEPETPFKEAEGEYVYEFIGWYVKKSNDKWEFEKDVVSKDTTLEARFVKKERAYAHNFKLKSDTIEVMGEEYPLFTFNQDMADAYTLIVKDSKNNEIEGVSINADGSVNLTLYKGTYKYELSAENASSPVKGVFEVTGDGGLTEIVCPVIVSLGTSLGTEADGYAYPSFTGGFSVSGDSVTLTNHSYVYVGDGKLTDTMYLEANVEISAPRINSSVGIMAASEYGNLSNMEALSNPAVGSSDISKNKLAFFLTEGNKLYSQVTTSWNATGREELASLDSGIYSAYYHKLAILRNGNNYYVFIDDVLMANYVTDAFGKGGFGFALINPVGTSSFVAKYTDVRYITSADVIEAMEKSLDVSVSVTVSDGVTVKQNGEEIEGLKMASGVRTDVTFVAPTGKVLTDVSVKADGEEIDVFFNGEALFFTPVYGKAYEISATYKQSATAILEVCAKPYAINVGGQSVALRSFEIIPSDVSVKIENLSLNETSTTTLSSLTQSLEVNSGIVKITATYKTNVWSTVVTVTDGETLPIDVYLSDAYLGGAITLDSTTYKSYNNASETATSGQAWALVSKQRDTVKLTNYTFAFQKEFVGSSYYIEGTFDSTVDYTLRSKFGGLLIAYGNGKLADASGENKYGAGIFGDSVVFMDAPDWNSNKAVVIANWKQLVTDYDPTAVKLGVLRDGTMYHFFVNDVYVASRVIDYVTGDSGIGVFATSLVDIVISDFNYSADDIFLNALKAQLPSLSEREIDIYLIAGQSNGSGYTSFYRNSMLAGDRSFIYGNNNVWYSGRAQYTVNTTSGEFGANEYEWGLALAGQGRSNSHMGAEVGMAKVLSEYYNPSSGKLAGIIKFAHGGTSLLNKVTGENNCDGNWVSPSYASYLNVAHSGKTGGLYRNFLAQVEKRIQELKAMGFTTINIKGLFWMQGESDRGSINEYRTAFKYFAKDIRKDLGEIVDEDLSDMAIIVGEISRTSGSAETGTANTNESFIAFQNTLPDIVNHVYVIKSGLYDINRLVNGSTTAVGTDSWHWNQHDMISIGKNVGKSILKNVLGV